MWKEVTKTSEEESKVTLWLCIISRGKIGMCSVWRSPKRCLMKEKWDGEYSLEYFSSEPGSDLWAINEMKIWSYIVFLFIFSASSYWGRGSNDLSLGVRWQRKLHALVSFKIHFMLWKHLKWGSESISWHTNIDWLCLSNEWCSSTVLFSLGFTVLVVHILKLTNEKYLFSATRRVIPGNYVFSLKIEWKDSTDTLSSVWMHFLSHSFSQWLLQYLGCKWSVVCKTSITSKLDFVVWKFSC